MKSRKRGTVLMLSGILLLTAALSLTLYNLWDENRAGHTAQAAVEYLSVELAESSTDEFTPDYLLDPDRDLPTVEVARQDYIGILTIPALGLELPVISQWSYPSLKAAPCRYAGSPYTNDLVIAAHNYRRHFGGIQDLAAGTSLAFTDMDGNVFSYEVADVELLEPTAVEEMTSGGWDLTLFTCTPGGKARVTVRCQTSAG